MMPASGTRFERIRIDEVNVPRRDAPDVVVVGTVDVIRRLNPILRHKQSSHAWPGQLPSQPGWVLIQHDQKRDLTAPPLVASRLVQRHLVG
tara:strand:- start:404 stop:676 length:273 start_codon:yes stop_codon:yes gene_type:complete